MISNQILQNTIDGLKGITRIDLCIIDVEGKILAATFPDAEKYVEPAQAFVESPADSQVVNGYQFFKVFDEMCIRDSPLVVYTSTQKERRQPFFLYRKMIKYRSFESICANKIM